MSDKKPRVGFVGIGMMGKPMSKRVLQAGYDLTVFDVRPEPVAELVKLGAKKAATPREMAEQTDVVLTCLPTLQACEEVWLSDTGLLKGVRQGQYLVETSTVAPAQMKRYVEAFKGKGVTILDASLLAGGRPGLPGAADDVAAQGKIMVVAGGETAQVEAVRPVLETFGNPVLHMGPLGTGALTKVLANALSHANFAVACEVLAVGAKAGADMKNLHGVLNQTGGRSWVMEGYVPQYLKDGTGRVMRTVVAVKDGESMLEVARELGVPVLMQALTQTYYEWANHEGLKDRPWVEMLKLWEGVIGKPIRFK